MTRLAPPHGHRTLRTQRDAAHPASEPVLAVGSTEPAASAEPALGMEPVEAVELEERNPRADVDCHSAAATVSTLPNHRAVAEAVAVTLSHLVQEPSAQARLDLRCDLVDHLSAHLTPFERQSLAWAALASCGEEEAWAVVDTLLPLDEEGAGLPGVPLNGESLVADAQMWAVVATRAERLAYVLALLDALSPRDRAVLTTVAADTGPFEGRFRRLVRGRRGRRAERSRG